MRNTVPVHFNHHSKRGGRTAFGEWSTGENKTDFSLEPVFRYGRPFSDAVTELRVLAESQHDVYLCNIVQHSSALTCRPELDSKSDLAFNYVDIDALIKTPSVTGFNVDDDVLADALTPMRGWQAICGEHSFDDSSREAGLTKVALLPADSSDGSSEGTLHCQLSDPSQFAVYWRSVTFPIYFLPASVSLDFPIIADRFRRDRLSNYLLRRVIPFGTMGECHVDDDIAVAYLSPSFDFPPTLRCFIR